jgi:hypothetical protein
MSVHGSWIWLREDIQGSLEIWHLRDIWKRAGSRRLLGKNGGVITKDLVKGEWNNRKANVSDYLQMQNGVLTESRGR